MGLLRQAYVSSTLVRVGLAFAELNLVSIAHPS